MTAYAPAFPHDAIQEIFSGIYFIHGSIRIGPGMTMNRNMLVVQGEDGLNLINPVRLDEEGLAQLDELGEVRRVIRLGDFHGLDDAFYIDRYEAEFWCQPGQSTYTELRPSQLITADTLPPIRHAQLFVFESALFPEAALLLEDHRLLITTDSIQYHPDWSYTSGLTRFVLKLMGFHQGLLIGPPWLKRVTPRGGSMKEDFERLLSLDFEHLVAAHGRLLQGDAKEALKSLVKKTF